MAKRKSWEEMEREYPDEWLLICDIQRDDHGRLESGVVVRHSKDKEEVYRPPALAKPTAFRYTGASTFAGLGSHVQINTPV